MSYLQTKNERVKFFDYIIPIIPFINASNAGVKLNELIETRNLNNVLSSDFIQDIVSFIDDIDMRLLINIFHEFCIYRHNIRVEVEDNLFAMIVYKNMYPDDFGKLSKREGNLYGFISNKSKYIEELINEISASIQGEESQLRAISNEQVESEKELRAIYINAIHEMIPNVIAYLLREKVPFSEINNEENFEKIKESNNLYYFYYEQRYGSLNSDNSSVSFSDIETHVNPTLSYEKRLQFIREKHNGKINQIKKEIETLTNKKNEIQSWSLKEVFQEIDIEAHLGSFSNSQMMRSLLVNGYINEDYEDYTTLFHEGIITRADEAFNRKIKSGIASEFNYQLSDKVGNLIKDISDKYFKREVILNFDLLDSLCENKALYESKYHDFISILTNGKETSMRFIEAYINRELYLEEQQKKLAPDAERKNHLPIFVNSLCKEWSDWWNYICKSNNTDEKLNHFLKIIIENSDIENIKTQNNESNLSIFIELTPNFLTLISINQAEKIKEILKSFDIKFKRIEAPNEEVKALFDFVHNNNFYEINEENISLMLSLYAPENSLKKLKEAHYTTIIESGCKPLIDYVNGNIVDYVKVLLGIPESNQEPENSLLLLLNNEELSTDIRANIIKKQKNIITDLSKILNNDIQQSLTEYNKIAVTWKNLYLYYESLEDKAGLDETLIAFLNKKENYTLLSKQAIKCELKEQQEETIKAFSLKIIYCNELNYESYISLIKSTPYTWTSLNFEHLDEDKVKRMVDTCFLNLTTDNFNKLKDNFPNEHIKLIEKHQDKLFSVFDELPLEADDVLLLLKSKEISQKNKVKLITLIDDSFIIDNRDIAKLSCDILADSNFISLSFDITKSLINSSSLKENKIKVINKQASELSDSQIQSLIGILGQSYQKLFKKQNKPTFSDTVYHRTLFDSLKKRKLIKRYEKSKDGQLRAIANY